MIILWYCPIPNCQLKWYCDKWSTFWYTVILISPNSKLLSVLYVCWFLSGDFWTTDIRGPGTLWWSLFRYSRSLLGQWLRIVWLCSTDMHVVFYCIQVNLQWLYPISLHWSKLLPLIRCLLYVHACCMCTCNHWSKLLPLIRYLPYVHTCCMCTCNHWSKLLPLIRYLLYCTCMLYVYM